MKYNYKEGIGSPVTGIKAPLIKFPSFEVTKATTLATCSGLPIIAPESKIYLENSVLINPGKMQFTLIFLSNNSLLKINVKLIKAVLVTL